MDAKIERRRQHHVMIALVVALGLWSMAAATNALIDVGATAHDLFCSEHGSLR